MQLHYVAAQEQDIDLNQQLRMELGWKDVKAGLGLVLFGYLVFLFGVLVGTGMVVWSSSGWLFGGATAARLPTIGQMWIFYIGLGVLSVIGTFGYLFVLAGHWKCLLAAPERHGARWLMFFATTCLFFGPAVNVASGIGGMQRPPQLSRGARSLTEVQFTTTGQYLHLASSGAGLLYSVFFLLFLRSIAKCHRSASHVTLISFFFALVAVLVAGSGYLLYALYRGRAFEGTVRDLALFLGIGWVLCYFLYLFTIGSLRRCIADSLDHMRSPLDVY